MTKNYQNGWIQIVVIIIVAVLILSYFGFNIEDAVESEAAQENFSYLGRLFVALWDNFLSIPVLWLYNNILIPIYNLFIRLANIVQG